MKKIICLILIVLISCFVSATDYYEQVGNDNGYFQLGTGFFNSQLSDVCGVGDLDCFPREISSPKFTPLVADLDNDTINEIIVFDGKDIKIYNSSPDSFLGIIDAVTVTQVIETGLIYDIDGDGYKEIIVSSKSGGNGYVEIVRYNGTATTLLTTLDLSGEITTTHESSVTCRGENDCLVAYSDRATYLFTDAGDMKVSSFNSSHIINTTTIYTGTSNNVECLPSIRHIPFIDYDNDGDIEYFVSYFDMNTRKVNIGILDVDVLGSITLEQTIIVDGTISMGMISCSAIYPGHYANVNSMFTAPLVFDIDGGSSNGFEIAIGVMTDTDEFKIYVYKSNGDLLDDYPEVSDGNGLLVSNIARFNAFPDTADVDFCVMGYDWVDELLDLVCGSEQSGLIFETQKFRYDAEDFSYNVSAGYHTMIHSGQHSTATTDGNNLDELVCSYGIFTLDYSEIFINTRNLGYIWENPKGDSTIITSDINSIGREQMLVLTDTNIWLLTDGYALQGGEIDYYCTYPCIDAVWKVSDENTSREAEVTIKVIDADGNQVSARAILFYGETFAQDSGWSVNGSSDTTFTFNFQINESISNSVLRLMGRDTSNPDDESIIDLTVSTGLNGVIKEDCFTCVDITTSVDAEDLGLDNESDALSEDNLETIRNEAMAMTGVDAKYAGLIGFLFVFLLTVGVFWGMVQAKINDSRALVIIPAITCVISWVAMVYFKFIAGWTVIVGILFVAGLLSLKFYNQSQGNGGV